MRQLFSGVFFLVWVVVFIFFSSLSNVCNSHFGCPVWSGSRCRGGVWSQQGTPHGTGMMAEGRHRTAAGILTADDYDFIF